MAPGWALLGAALLLSLERACYVAIARVPDRFRRLCARPWVAWIGEPVVVVGALFCAFKALQLAVFAGWCWAPGRGSVPPAPDLRALSMGVPLLLAGQALNWSVFRRLGARGVFYGDLLGHELPWCRGFPFSLCAHPQYVGAVLSIWGLFLAARFPADDWYWLPALETVYYAAGTRLETLATLAPKPDRRVIGAQPAPRRVRTTMGARG